MNVLVVAVAVAITVLFATAVVLAIRKGRMSTVFGCALIGQNLLWVTFILVPLSRPVRLTGIVVLVAGYFLADRWSRRRRRAAEPRVAADRAAPGR